MYKGIKNNWKSDIAHSRDFDYSKTHNLNYALKMFSAAEI